MLKWGEFNTEICDFWKGAKTLNVIGSCKAQRPLSRWEVLKSWTIHFFKLRWIGRWGHDIMWLEKIIWRCARPPTYPHLPIHRDNRLYLVKLFLFWQLLWCNQNIYCKWGFIVYFGHIWAAQQCWIVCYFYSSKHKCLVKASIDHFSGDIIPEESRWIIRGLN